MEEFSKLSSLAASRRPWSYEQSLLFVSQGFHVTPEQIKTETRWIAIQHLTFLPRTLIFLFNCPFLSVSISWFTTVPVGWIRETGSGQRRRPSYFLVFLQLPLPSWFILAFGRLLQSGVGWGNEGEEMGFSSLRETPLMLPRRKRRSPDNGRCGTKKNLLVSKRTSVGFPDQFSSGSALFSRKNVDSWLFEP